MDVLARGVSSERGKASYDPTYYARCLCARVVVYATSLTDSAPSPELGEKPCAIQRPGASSANETLIAALLCFVRERREYQPEGPNVKPSLTLCTGLLPVGQRPEGIVSGRRQRERSPFGPVVAHPWTRVRWSEGNGYCPLTGGLQSGHTTPA